MLPGSGKRHVDDKFAADEAAHQLSASHTNIIVRRPLLPNVPQQDLQHGHVEYLNISASALTASSPMARASGCYATADIGQVVQHQAAEHDVQAGVGVRQRLDGAHAMVDLERGRPVVAEVMVRATPRSSYSGLFSGLAPRTGSPTWAA
jgi:hypothetical protein